ncbi:TetR family transcriptional regulator [Paenibacillus sambharensis]|uniref:TetR family transcriptional regulator n=1 Tax=Paenibacillus sambharensis TaxID=1803190 RepID=UPI0015E8947C|nr:TetR family transcriptional regulator [Paenibacillus sambharensis]
MCPEETDVKLRILLAARKLFARQGYDGTSVRQICEEAKVNVALVSYHFGGKENLFSALFDAFFPGQRVQEVLEQKLTPLAGIKLVVREITLTRLREPELISLLQQEIVFQSPRIDIIRKHAFPVWTYVRDLLLEGREQGVFRFRSIDHTFMSMTGAILFHKKSDYFRPLFTEEQQDSESLIADITEFVLRGLGVDPTASAEE